jgi:hypothetical protein
LEKLNTDIKELIIQERKEWSDNDHGFWVSFKPSMNNKIPEPKRWSTPDLDGRIEMFENKKKIYSSFNGDDNGSLIIAEMLSNLSGYKLQGTIELARTDDEINSFRQAVEIIFDNYQSLIKFNKLINVPTSVTDENVIEAYKASRNMSEQLKQIKKPIALSSSLFPSHKFKDILELLYSFQTHYEIYTNFQNKMYNIDVLKSKYDKYTRYKVYVNFINKIKTIYEYNDVFKLDEIETMLADGELVKQRKSSGFENEYIRLHIDLIKGKVTDENVKQFACEYKDHDLVVRWNNLDIVDDDSDEIVHMNYFTVDDKEAKGKKQIKNGGKQTRRYRHTKRKQTRKK